MLTKSPQGGGRLYIMRRALDGKLFPSHQNLLHKRRDMHPGALYWLNKKSVLYLRAIREMNEWSSCLRAPLVEYYADGAHTKAVLKGKTCPAIFRGGRKNGRFWGFARRVVCYFLPCVF
jgi:hypothetical protein